MLDVYAFEGFTPPSLFEIFFSFFCKILFFFITKETGSLSSLTENR